MTEWMLLKWDIREVKVPSAVHCMSSVTSNRVCDDIAELAPALPLHSSDFITNPAVDVSRPDLPCIQLQNLEAYTCAAAHQGRHDLR